MERDIAIDYLRGGVTILVVAHHSALAYNTFSSYDPTHYSWSTAPIVDPSRWALLDYFVAWNDIYFMALLFFVSGLFVPASLGRKGAGRFFLDRLQRLGIPFAFAVSFLMPMAYYPSWRLGNDAGAGGFIRRFFTLDGWPVGPPWFLWILVVFCAAVALSYWLIPRFRKGFDYQPKSPWRLAALFLVVGILTIAPLRLFAAPFSWSTLGGPLDFQTSRVLLYLAYFVLGVRLGGENIGRSLSLENLRLWPLWLVLALVSFGAHWFLSGGTLLKGLPPWAAKLGVGVVFGVCCASTSLAALGVVRVFVRRSWKPADSFSANAYGVYIIHYVFVIWLQFILLSVLIPAALKFAITFLFALIASWLATASLRRTAIRRFL